MILLIDNYDSFTYNLYQMVQAQTDEPVTVYRNNALSFDEVVALKPSRIILSPGPGHPAIPGDFNVCQDIIQRFDNLQTKLLGVCLGHQGIGHYWGKATPTEGTVIQAPDIVHGKTCNVQITDDTSPLFHGLPNPFQAMRYHSLVVDPAQISSELKVTAVLKSAEPKNQLVMALQHKSKPIYGVQFHPESIGTPLGAQLLKNFLERC